MATWVTFVQAKDVTNLDKSLSSLKCLQNSSQNENVYKNILHNWKWEGNYVYFRIKLFFHVVLHKSTNLKPIWSYIHYEIQKRIIKTYCDIFREEAKWIGKWICSWELLLSANGMLRNAIETLKNPAIQLHLCTSFEQEFQRVTFILLGLPICKLELIVKYYFCGFYEVFDNNCVSGMFH